MNYHYSSNEWFTVRKINHIFILSFNSLKMKVNKIILVDKKGKKQEF